MVEKKTTGPVEYIDLSDDNQDLPETKGDSLEDIEAAIKVINKTLGFAANHIIVNKSLMDPFLKMFNIQLTAEEKADLQSGRHVRSGAWTISLQRGAFQMDSTV